MALIYTEIATSVMGCYKNITKNSSREYKIKAGTDDDVKPKDFTDLREFIKFVNSSARDITTEEWEKHLDTDGFTSSYVDLAFIYAFKSNGIFKYNGS